MHLTQFEKRIATIIEPLLDDMGFELVRIKLTGEGRKPTIQIMIDKQDENTNVSIDDCANISREISTIFEVEEPIEEEYILEVSSPGIDRPLTRPKDFVRYIGFMAKVEISPAFEGRKRFKGEIVDANKEEGFTLELENKEQIDISFAAVVKAKLILTDELLKMVAN